MRRLLQVISGAAFVGTVLPSAVYLAGGLDLPGVHRWMWVSMVVWFAATPWWMGRPNPS